MTDCYSDATDRIAIESFYPFLAFQATMMHASQPHHFSLAGRILNEGDPKEWMAFKFPDGWESKLILVDDRKLLTPYDPWTDRDPSDWWPTAPEPAVRDRLRRRIAHEGYILPVLTALSLSLLSALYTASSASTRRARLRYRSSPIADFGIARGSVRVTTQDRLAYMRLSDGTIVHGQDPKDHFWLYFTTARGENLILDVGLLPFNMLTVVKTERYAPNPLLGLIVPIAPAFFEDRVIRTGAPPLHTERSRVSVLRNEALHGVVERVLDTPEKCDRAEIYRFMEGLAERTMTELEKEMTRKWVAESCKEVARNIAERKWQSYPDVATMDILSEPGEDDPVLEEVQLLDPQEIKRMRRRATGQ